MEIIIIDSEPFFSIQKNVLENLVNRLKKDLNFSVSSLQINIVSSQCITKINSEFLNHDYSTDIVTLNYSGRSRELEGELYISYDDAKKNADSFGCSLNSEIIRLVIHGILHMLGYDDHTDEDIARMKEVENKFVIKFENLSTENIVEDDR